MAGSYYEKEKSYSQSNSTSVSTSFKQQQVLRPEDLNQLGEDAVLLITNHGYVRTNKEGSAYYKTEPFKSQYKNTLHGTRKLWQVYKKHNISNPEKASAVWHALTREPGKAVKWRISMKSAGIDPQIGASSFELFYSVSQ